MKNRLQKAMSLLLATLMLFSVVVLNENSVFAATETYYVSADGSDSAAGSSSAPLKTIAKAIEKAKESGLTVGDTVTLKMVGFRDVGWGEYIEHDFALEITSSTSSRCNVSIPTTAGLGGSTRFDNCVIKSDILYFNDNSVVVEENCVLDGGNYYLGSETNKAKTVAQQDVVINATCIGKDIFITDKNAGENIENKNINLYIDNPNARPNIHLIPQSGSVTFENNINIYLYDTYTGNAQSVTFIKDGEGTTTVNGAVQLIAKPDANFTETLSVLKSLNAAGGFYHITNSTGVDDLLELTETAGNYVVDTQRYTVTATKKDGSKTVSGDGILTLTGAGEYEITTTKITETMTYYVSSSGKAANSGLTKDKPLSSIGEAVLAAKEAGYWGGDTVTVKILSKTVDWGISYLGKVDSNTIKATDRQNEKFGYDFLLVVTSEDTSNKATITIPNLSPMMGDIKFDYVNISKVDSFVCYDDNVTMTKNVSFNPNYFSLGYRRKANSVVEELDVTLNNQFNGYIQMTNDLYSGKKFNEDVTVTVNNSNSTPKIVFVLYWRGPTTFNGNLNINIANAKSVTFGPAYAAPEGDRSSGQTVAKKAVHIIVNSKTQMDSASISNLEGLSEDGKLYHISNNTGVADILDFTKDEGKFKVKSGHTVTAVNESGKTTVSKNGYLTLTSPGYYSISTQISTSGTCTSGHKYSNSCDGMCNVCGATRTIKHNFKYSCSRACTTCGIKRIKYHSIAVRVIPATDKKDGENQDICDVCYTVLARYKIEKIKSSKLSMSTFTYNGKAKNPEVIMVDTAGEELVEKVDYTLSYPKGRTKVGTYKVKVKLKGEFKGTKYLSFKVNPGRTSISKVSPGSKSLTVKWKKKTTQVTGYQIQYSTSKKFTEKYTKTKTIKSNKTTSTTLKGLKSNKVYYIRIRTYKSVDGKRYYSKWSSAKTGASVVKTSVSKVSTAKKSLKVKIKKSTKVSGYQIQYSTSKKFTSKYTKTKTIKGYKTTSVTLKKLKAKKTYYVRVRTYKTINGKKYYSAWSSYKTKKTK